VILAVGYMEYSVGLLVIPLSSVAVVGDIGALSVTSSTTSVGSLGGLSVSDDSCVKSCLSSRHILSLTLPGLESRGLKSSAVGERKSPWASNLSDLVHLVKVKGCFFL